jgi:hypothetical protein
MSSPTRAASSLTKLTSVCVLIMPRLYTRRRVIQTSDLFEPYAIFESVPARPALLFPGESP